MTTNLIDQDVDRFELARTRLGSELERRLATIRELRERGDEHGCREHERDWFRLLDTRYYLEVSDEDAIDSILNAPQPPASGR